MVLFSAACAHVTYSSNPTCDLLHPRKYLRGSAKSGFKTILKFILSSSKEQDPVWEKNTKNAQTRKKETQHGEDFKPYHRRFVEEALARDYSPRSVTTADRARRLHKQFSPNGAAFPNPKRQKRENRFLRTDELPPSSYSPGQAPTSGKTLRERRPGPVSKQGPVRASPGYCPEGV